MFVLTGQITPAVFLMKSLQEKLSA